jgi:hypothetical protein
LLELAAQEVLDHLLRHGDSFGNRLVLADAPHCHWLVVFPNAFNNEGHVDSLRDVRSAGNSERVCIASVWPSIIDKMWTQKKFNTSLQ